MVCAEKQRLAEAGPWRRWGPYLSERQWGTVREATGGGDVWESFTHDQARYRAYRWGEDGLGDLQTAAFVSLRTFDYDASVTLDARLTRDG